MKKPILICIMLFAALVLSAVSCSGNEQPGPVQDLPVAEATPDADTVAFDTPEPTAVVTLEPVPTPTPTPEPTPTPVPTPTPTPEPTPVPEKIGIIKSIYLDRFSDEVIDTDDTYRDKTISVVWKQYETTERTGRTLSYFVADIYVQNVESIRRALSGPDYKRLTVTPMEKLAAANHTIVSLSGDHCTSQYKSYVVVNGEELYKTNALTRDLCVLFRDGEMRTYSPKNVSYEYLKDRGVWQTWNFGPMLLDDEGEPLKKFNLPDGISGRNPRAVIGYYEPGHYCLVVVDGRQSGYSIGLDLYELGVLMKDLGCVRAYNLDGGISAQMTWHDKRINHPGYNRSIIDIVYVPYPEEAPQEP